jgi:hypothetical protein
MKMMLYFDREEVNVFIDPLKKDGIVQIDDFPFGGWLERTLNPPQRSWNVKEGRITLLHLCSISYPEGDSE